MILRGKAWKYGHNIDTDQIISAKYLVTGDPAELGRHCLETLDPQFSKTVRKGDILVGLKNFGCGSSREHAPISIKGAGVAAVVAQSFARIFYRNSINLGLPLFEASAAEEIAMGDELELDDVTGEIKNLTQGKTYKALGLPDFAREIMADGGLMSHIAKKRGLKKAGATGS